VKATTRDELDLLAAFLRARLGGPGEPVTTTPSAASPRLRTVEQAVLGVDAYLQLAARRPTPPGLHIEEQRARALWQILLDLAALWPDHPDNPRLRAPVPPPATDSAPEPRACSDEGHSDEVLPPPAA
jgi:hypothetical protein